MLRYEKLPEGLRGGMQRYVEHRIRPGHFLVAVLENDLVEAFNRADGNNRARMHDIAAFLYNELPARDYGICWGSPSVVAAWLAGGDDAE